MLNLCSYGGRATLLHMAVSARQWSDFGALAVQDAIASFKRIPRFNFLEAHVLQVQQKSSAASHG